MQLRIHFTPDSRQKEQPVLSLALTGACVIEVCEAEETSSPAPSEACSSPIPPQEKSSSGSVGLSAELSNDDLSLLEAILTSEVNRSKAQTAYSVHVAEIIQKLRREVERRYTHVETR